MSGMGVGVAGAMTGAVARSAASLAAGTAADLSAAATARQARLAGAAQQFEGMLLEELLKPMQRSHAGGFAATDGNGDGDDGAGDGDGSEGSLDTLTSYGIEAVAQALARQGGLGLARTIVTEVARGDPLLRAAAAAGVSSTGAGGGRNAGFRPKSDPAVLKSPAP